MRVNLYYSSNRPKLARRGLMVTVFMTAKNADRFLTGLDRSGIRLAELRFPSADVGLPEGCENSDTLPEPAMIVEFVRGLDMLQHPAEELFGQLHPRPCCIISNMYFPWTLQIANKFRIPRITFSGVSSFFLVSVERLLQSDLMETVESDSDYFNIPGLPDRVEFTKDQLTYVQLLRNMPEAPLRQMALADEASYGAIVNSFQELEPGYVEEYKRARKGKAWCVGPLSLNKAETYEDEWFRWLDSWPRGSVVYACMGSTHNMVPAQVKELGLGLEASNKPFVWVVKGGEGVQKWIEEDGFEEWVKGRGLLIRGWAPQVGILSHPAVGGFLTHCGWNSVFEGISAGLPLITWPMFGDQFGNQKLVEQVLEIGVGVGAEAYMKWGEEEKIGVLVKKEDVKRAIERVMDEGEEGDERRKRVGKLGESAERAVEEGGSSHKNLSMLIEDIIQQAKNRT